MLSSCSITSIAGELFCILSEKYGDTTPKRFCGCTTDTMNTVTAAQSTGHCPVDLIPSCPGCLFTWRYNNQLNSIFLSYYTYSSTVVFLLVILAWAVSVLPVPGIVCITAYCCVYFRTTGKPRHGYVSYCSDLRSRARTALRAADEVSSRFPFLVAQHPYSYKRFATSVLAVFTIIVRMSNFGSHCT